MRSDLPVRAVTLDVGGTLMEPWPSVGHIYAVAGARNGFPGLDSELLSERFLATWKAQSAFDYSREAWRRIVADCFRDLVPPTQISAVFESAYTLFARADSWRVHSDVGPFLKQLRSLPLKVGVVSNFDERLGPLLDELNLGWAFDVVIASKSIGIHKPTPGIFLECCRRLDVQPSDCLHVGDSVREDWAGATAAGMRGFLVDRSGRRDKKQNEPWLASLDEILDKLMINPPWIVD